MINSQEERESHQKHSTMILIKSGSAHMNQGILVLIFFNFLHFIKFQIKLDLLARLNQPNFSHTIKEVIKDRPIF